ncbi:MAG TPA: Gfo/Idh/MocA family oxidoreductase [Propionibacteriaceae bacterium]
MSERLRAGVIGLGWAGQQHMAAYANAENVDLVALAGMEADQLETLGDHYGVEAGHRYAEWKDLIALGELDVVSIATPTTLHHPMAVAGLDAGLHVLSEKPMAENGNKAREMVEAARRNDRVLDVSFNHRRRGDVQALKKIVDAGLLGDIYYAKAGWLRREGIPGLGSWFTRLATAGGGPLMDIGVHMLDMALYLLGEPQVHSATAATYAEFGPKGRGSSTNATMRKTGIQEGAFDVEDLSTAFLRLEGGGTLLLESSWAQWIPRDQAYVTLYGSEGGASVEWGGTQADPYRTMKIWTEVQGVAAELQPDIPPDGEHYECVVDFLAKVRSGSFSGYRGEDALARAVVVDACYDSAHGGGEVLLTT